MFKVLTKGCEPTRGTKHSACVDLFASEDVVIGAGETVVIGLGVAIDLDKLVENSNGMFDAASFDMNSGGWIDSQFNEDYFNEFKSSHYLQIALRSSLGKAGLIMPNGIGIIDMDYTRELKVIVHNPLTQPWTDVDGNTTIGKYFQITKGQRIAQITLLEHKSYLFGIESDVVRDGGFGSTGK